MPFSAPPPSRRGQFLYPEREQKQTFFDPLPPHLVHVVIEWPLRTIPEKQSYFRSRNVFLYFCFCELTLLLTVISNSVSQATFNFSFFEGKLVQVPTTLV